MVEVAEFAKAVIGDWNNSFIGINSAEGIIFSWNVKIGKDVVGGRLPDVG
jgi:hypothetical protein